MVTGWRRAFCTTIPQDGETRTTLISEKPEKQQEQSNPSPRFCSKLGFLSTGINPSTPLLKCRTAPATPTMRTKTPEESPKLQTKSSTKSPRVFSLSNSNPSSPRFPSSFALLKAKLSKSRCGICLQSVKTGQGTAIFTAECAHTFHFPCISSHVKGRDSLICPVCNCQWKDVPLLTIHQHQPQSLDLHTPRDQSRKQLNRCDSITRVYDDDEPLLSPRCRFNPIPESDENDDGNDEFQGFFAQPKKENENVNKGKQCVAVKLSPETALVSCGRSYETYVIAMKVKAPPLPASTSPLLNPGSRAPVDLVTVLDVSGSMTGDKLRMMKSAMRHVISSLSSNDRLSIVAFSNFSKRLLPLRRMTVDGRRTARKIVDSLTCGQGTCIAEALKKAAKVLEDRRERNPVATIMLLSDGHDDRVPNTSSNHRPPPGNSRFFHLEIPVHGSEPAKETFAKSVGGLLSVVVPDLKLKIGFISGSGPVEIEAVYSTTGSPVCLGSGCIRIGDLYAEEERDLLIELKVPLSAGGSHHVLSVGCSYKDPSTHKLTSDKDQMLLVSKLQAVRSNDPRIERLRNHFITTRALAENRVLVEHGDFTGGHQLLSSARALLLQWGSAEEYLRAVEAELGELQWRRQRQMQIQRQRSLEREVAYVDGKGEPLTPTSAWRAAEKLAKVAIMRKSLNRVSDLHGFENARF
ncbi:Zinc finger, RING-type [Dillenia turbinata]|uniref:Zinc finger, RING-type n=1 Tax=Dillenia turbinata TaxID=194707 RepID=A0AAN8Z1R1_9MAGN